MPPVATTAQTSIVAISQCQLEVGTGQPAACITLDRNDLEVEHARNHLRGGVRLICHRHAEAAIMVRMPRPPPRPGRGQCVEVGNRRTAQENSAGALGESDQIGQPAQGLILGHGRPGRFQPRRTEDRRCRERHVHDLGRGRRRMRHEGEEARVVDRQAIGGDHLSKEVEGRGRSDPARRDRSTQQSENRGGIGRRLQRLDLMRNPCLGVPNRPPQQPLHLAVERKQVAH